MSRHNNKYEDINYNHIIVLNDKTVVLPLHKNNVNAPIYLFVKCIAIGVLRYRTIQYN